MREQLPLRDMEALSRRLSQDTEGLQFKTTPRPSLKGTYDADEKYSKEQELIQSENESAQFNIVQGVQGAFQETVSGVMLSHSVEMFDVGDADIAFNPHTYDSEFKPLSETEDLMLSRAINHAHYWRIREHIQTRRDYLKNAQSAGFMANLTVGAIAEVANITNYIPLGLGALSKMNKVKRAVTVGTGQAAINVAETAFVDSYYEDRTKTEYLMTSILGFTIAGALANRVNVQTKGAAESVQRQEKMADDYVEKHMKNVFEERTLREQGSAGAMHVRADLKTLDPEMLERARNAKVDLDDPLAVAAFISKAEGKLDKVEPGLIDKSKLSSMGGETQLSDNPLMRQVGQDLIEKPETDVGKVLDDHTAALEIDMEFKKLGSTYADPLLSIVKRFSKHGKGEVKYLGKHVYYRLHTNKPIDTLSKQQNILVEEAADLYKSVMEPLTARAHAAGVEEFADPALVAKNLIQRSWEPVKMADMSVLHTEDTLMELIHKSLVGDGGFAKIYEAEVKRLEAAGKAQAADTKVIDAKAEIVVLEGKLKKVMAGKNTDARWGKATLLEKQIDDLKLLTKPTSAIEVDMNVIARKMAKATYNRMSKRAFSPSADANLLSTGNQRLMRDIIRDMDVDQATKDSLYHIMKTQGRDARGNITHSRMHMDMTAEVISPKTGEKIGIVDLFDTDIGAGAVGNMRYWIGRTAMARKGAQYASESALEKNADSISKMGEGMDQTPKEVKADMDRYKAMINLLLGRPIERMEGADKLWMRNLRKVTQLNVMNKLALPQAAETGRMLSAVGGNMITNIPMLGKFIADAITGKLDTALVKNLEDFSFGKIGSDYSLNHPMFRVEDFGHHAGSVESMLNKGTYWQGKLSGWHAVHTSQRKWLINGLSQKYYRQVLDGTMSQVQKNDIGLSKAMEVRIKADMKKFATTTADGRRTKNLNIEQWNPETARFFGQLVHRKANNAIQDLLIGEIPTWMNKETAKFFTQFRSFAAGAVNKQTRRDWHKLTAGDMEPATSAAFGMMTATMAATLKIYWASLTQDDPEGYREEHLQVPELIAQASAWSGNLGAFADFGSVAFAAVGQGNISGRQGNKYTDISSVVPSLGMINKLARAPGKLLDADLKAAASFVPFKNHYLMDILFTGLPD